MSTKMKNPRYSRHASEWTLRLKPEEYRVIIDILESGDFEKVKGKSNDN